MTVYVCLFVFKQQTAYDVRISDWISDVCSSDLFTDPMADGPAIQASSLRALKAGQTMRKTLALVEAFRAGDADTPIVLMGYYNPIYSYGVEAFLADAIAAGVDGLIVVDLQIGRAHV